MKLTKKYKVIAKVSSDKFVKYNVNDLLSFSRFLDAKFSEWRWFNVFDKLTGEQIGSYTCKDRPTRKHHF